jgi:hypothetical protein
MLAVTLTPQLERAASNDLACPVWKTGAHPSMPDPQLAES